MSKPNWFRVFYSICYCSVFKLLMCSSLHNIVIYRYNTGDSLRVPISAYLSSIKFWQRLTICEQYLVVYISNAQISFQSLVSIFYQLQQRSIFFSLSLVISAEAQHQRLNFSVLRIVVTLKLRKFTKLTL